MNMSKAQFRLLYILAMGGQSHINRRTYARSLAALKRAKVLSEPGHPLTPNRRGYRAIGFIWAFAEIPEDVLDLNPKSWTPGPKFNYSDLL